MKCKYKNLILVKSKRTLKLPKDLFYRKFGYNDFIISILAERTFNREKLLEWKAFPQNLIVYKK